MPGGVHAVHLPVNWATYRLSLFGIQARMIGLMDGRVLWHAYRDIGPEDVDKLTLDVSEFEAN